MRRERIARAVAQVGVSNHDQSFVARSSSSNGSRTSVSMCALKSLSLSNLSAYALGGAGQSGVEHCST